MFATIGALIALSSAGDAPIAVWDVDWRTGVKRLVKAHFIDPDSVKFQLPVLAEDVGKAPLYCGLANGKTRAGGYDGAAPFIVMLAPGAAGSEKAGQTMVMLFLPLSSDGDIEKRTYAKCAESGYDMRAARLLESEF